MSTDTWQSIRRELLNNARRVSVEGANEIEQWAPVKAHGTEFLPAYIPYIGSDYFSCRTHGQRILAYALSQNLRETDPSAHEWAQDWRQGDGQWALDRQNIAFQTCGTARMHPFDTGHIPILASLLRSAASGRCPDRDESIYPEIAATNLSKFSFRTEDGRRATDKLDALRRCWEWFSELEVKLLRPGYILCCGRRVHDIVSAGVAEVWPDGGCRPLVLYVPFPGLLVINSRYRKELGPEHLSFEEMALRIAGTDLDHSVDRDLTLREVLQRDQYYFTEMHRTMDKQRLQ